MRFSSAGAELGLDVLHLNLDGLHGNLAPTALDGRIDARLGGTTQSATATLTQRDLRLSVEATRQDAEVSVSRFSVNHRGGRLDGHGRIRLDGQQSFAADLRFNGIDPSRFTDAPSARLSGSTRLEGSLAPAWRLQGRFELRDSLLRGLPVSGSGSVSADAGRIATPGTIFRVGDNRLRVSGAYGRPGDSLSLKLDAQRLADIDPRLAGGIAAEGTVSGRVTQPEMRLEFQGEKLGFSDYRAAVIHGNGAFAYGRDPVLRLSVSGEGLNLPSFGELATAKVEFDGRQSDHTARIDATGRILDATTELHGSYANARWTGEVTAFENRGRYPTRLQAPVTLQVGPQEFHLGAAEIVGRCGQGAHRADRVRRRQARDRRRVLGRTARRDAGVRRRRSRADIAPAARGVADRHEPARQRELSRRT